MHAIFDGGPFGEDVGRCIPGPPPPDTLEVDYEQDGDVRRFTYYLRVVGSWSDPSDPIAVYGNPRHVEQRHRFSASPAALQSQSTPRPSTCGECAPCFQMAGRGALAAGHGGRFAPLPGLLRPIRVPARRC